MSISNQNKRAWKSQDSKPQPNQEQSEVQEDVVRHVKKRMFQMK